MPSPHLHKLKALIYENTGIEQEQIVPEARLIEDLLMDSLDLVEFVLALNEDFGLDIPDEAAEKFQTVGDVLEYLEEAVR